MITCDVQDCPRIENTLRLRKKAQVTISREKSREIATFCSIIREFSILLAAMIMQYLYDSV